MSSLSLAPVSVATLSNHELLAETARVVSVERSVTAELIALGAPQPDVAPSVRRLPTARATEAAPSPTLSDAAAIAPGELLLEPEPTRLATRASNNDLESAVPLRLSRAEVMPLAPERYLIKVTVSGEAHKNLRRAQDLLRHALPTGDPAAIVERALAVLVDQLERRRLAKADAPRPTVTAVANSRRVPANIRRLVWERDGGQCAFVGADGRCAETGFLEFHHLVPYASGGQTSVENLALRCRAHNAYESVQHFGTRAGTSSGRGGSDDVQPAAAAPAATLARQRSSRMASRRRIGSSGSDTARLFN